MKLDNIVLKNFRCYQSLELDLHPQMTVLVANNGQGKTTVLDAIRIGLWPYVGSFDLAKTAYADPANTITVGDALLLKNKHDRARQLPSEITLTGDYGQGHQSWKRYRDSEARKSQTKDDVVSKQLKKFVLALQDNTRNLHDTPISLPVFGYYGTGRLWKEKRLMQNKTGSKNRKADENIRTFAYRDCLDPASSYKQFEEWFTSSFKKIREEQIKQLESGVSSIQANPDIANPVMVVQKSVNTLLKVTGWQNVAYSETHDQSLVLQHPEKGTLKVDQLSDGIKNMLAMVADIAYRCALLNPHLGTDAALKTEGVVLIDEVDMHLHPAWQQTVVASLTEAFPKLQFVVTTHSPQVLSTVDAESIRLIHHEVNAETGRIQSVAACPEAQSRGIASADVLAAIMGVDPIPEVEEASWLSEYKALIQTGMHESEAGECLKKKLITHFGAEHQVMLECARLIRLQAMKAKFFTRNEAK